MKIFKYCNKQLNYVPYSLSFFAKLITSCVLIILIVSTVLALFFNSLYQQRSKIDLTDELKIIVLHEENKFDKTKLVHYLKNLNIKFPHIVYAQAILESTDFQSQIFKENNNMFGMKVARLRQTTNVGEQYNHAVFDTWKECVIDYALYQARYLSDIKTEKQYFQYLEKMYAEDPNYVSKLKSIINSRKLQQLNEILN